MVRVNLMAAAAGAPYYLALYWNALGEQVADGGNQVEKHVGKGEHPYRRSAVGHRVCFTIRLRTGIKIFSMPNHVNFTAL
jgi:hypothetical protein